MFFPYTFLCMYVFVYMCKYMFLFFNMYIYIQKILIFMWVLNIKKNDEIKFSSVHWYEKMLFIWFSCEICTNAAESVLPHVK